MPLILPALTSELISAYDKGPAGNPSPQIVGIDTAKAYMNYVSSGINAGGQAFTAMPGASALGQELGDIYSGKSPAGALTAQKMAKAFDTCLGTFLSVFQNTIITAPGLPGLIAGLADVLGAPNMSTMLYCNKLAKELNTYTLSAIVIGVIPDTPGIPFTGPIS